MFMYSISLVSHTTLILPFFIKQRSHERDFQTHGSRSSFLLGRCHADPTFDWIQLRLMMKKRMRVTANKWNKHPTIVNTVTRERKSLAIKNKNLELNVRVATGVWYLHPFDNTLITERARQTKTNWPPRTERLRKLPLVALPAG